MSYPKWYYDLCNAEHAAKAAANQLRQGQWIKAFESVVEVLGRMKAALPAASQECPECLEKFEEHSHGYKDIPPCSRHQQMMAEQAQENQPEAEQ